MGCIREPGERSQNIFPLISVEITVFKCCLCYHGVPLRRDVLVLWRGCCMLIPNLLSTTHPYPALTHLFLVNHNYLNFVEMLTMWEK